MSGACTQGSSRNLGDLASSTVKTGMGQPGDQVPARKRRAPGCGRDETRAQRWYSGVKATKRRRKGCEKSELFNSTCEAGERVPERTPWREEKSRATELPEGKMSGTLSPSSVSTKLRQVAKQSWLCRYRHNHDHAEFRIMPNCSFLPAFQSHRYNNRVVVYSA